ncbi:MAG: Gfo/Idh/MocA family protein [Succinivibrionaceae bacterium]
MTLYNDDKSLGVAIIGAGNMARKMIQTLMKMKRPITGIYSRNFNRAYSLIKEFGLTDYTTVYDSLPNLWNHDDSSYVYISSPTDTHNRYILDALFSQKHVLVESPLVLSVKELSDIQFAINSEKKIVMEQNSILYSPFLGLIASKIVEGKSLTESIGKIGSIEINLGQSFSKDDYHFDKLNGGVMYTLGSLALSTAITLMGNELELLSSYLLLDNETGIDLKGMFSLKNNKNVLCSIVTSLVENLPNTITIGAEKGYAIIFNFTTATSFIAIDLQGNKQVVDLKKEIISTYNLENYNFENEGDIANAVEIINFENAVSLGFDEFINNDTTHFKDSFETCRLIAEICAKSGVFKR